MLPYATVKNNEAVVFLVVHVVDAAISTLHQVFGWLFPFSPFRSESSIDLLIMQWDNDFYRRRSALVNQHLQELIVVTCHRTRDRFYKLRNQ
jgi:hypothetical protein